MGSREERSGLRVVLFVGAGVALIAAGVVLATNALGSRKVGSAASASSKPGDVTAEVAALRQEVRSLRTRVAESGAAPDPEPDPAGSVTENSTVDKPPAAAPARDFNVESSNLRGFLDRKVTAEAADRAWTRDIEGVLVRAQQRLLANNPRFDDIQVELVECGQSICRCRFAHKNEDSFAEFYQTVREDPLLRGGGHYHRTPVASGGFSTLLYVARQGQELPQQLPE